MKLPEVAPSQAECQRLVSEAMRSEDVRIYLDASVLIHCYEMSRSACEELLKVLDDLGQRVRVPVWAAKETWQVARGWQKKYPLRQSSASLSGRLDEFRSISLRLIDESTFDDLGVDDYVRTVDRLVSDFGALAKRVGQIELAQDAANALLLPFIESHALASDMTEIYAEVQRTAETRYTHGVPPGFADGGARNGYPDEVGENDLPTPPSGKKRNRYGDLIMWLEVLQDCRRTEAKHLMIITRDNAKNDWVYLPQHLRVEGGALHENGGLVTITLPLLVQEAKQRCPTLESVQVISLEMFTQTARSALSARVGNLARALQARARRSRSSGQATQRTAGRSVELAQAVSFSSEDMIYEPTLTEAADKIWQHIRGLRAEGWAAQNEAAAALVDLIPGASPEALKQIGRGIASAADEDAVEPAELAAQVLSDETLPAAARANLLVGLLAETYFDETGEPAKPKAAIDITEILFAKAGEPGMVQALEVTIGERLRPVRRMYLALPGEDESEIRLELLLSGSTLLGVRANGVGLLEADAPERRRLSVSGRVDDNTVPVSDLAACIAREFVVPRSMLRVDGPTSIQVEIPERMGFITWGPATGARLR